MGRVASSWDGFSWWIEDAQDEEILSKGEVSVLRALYRLADALRPEVFVDVGAHLGYYAVRMAKRCERVVAFEPNPISRAKLARNVALNGLDNVSVLPYACGEGSYRARLWLAGSGSTLLEGYVRGESAEVEVVPLDEVVERADIVKIDVEGYDWQVLKGMERLIEEQRPTIIIEHHDFRHYRTSHYPLIKEFLRGRGYMEVWLTVPHHLYYHRRRPLEAVGPLVADHWINHCIRNLEEGRPWYFGIPYTWWWGMNLIDFIYEIREHVLRPDEPKWVESL
jgi:FkbM family methyltransferase